MTEQIEKPCKQLAKKLLKDADDCEGLMACTFTTGGEVRAHGAGLIITNPELALYGTARLVFALLGKELPKHILNGSLTLTFKEEGGVHIEATDGVGMDPRSSLHLIGSALIEFSRLVAESGNVTEDVPKI